MHHGSRRASCNHPLATLLTIRLGVAISGALADYPYLQPQVKAGSAMRGEAPKMGAELLLTEDSNELYACCFVLVLFHPQCSSTGPPPNVHSTQPWGNPLCLPYVFKIILIHNIFGGFFLGFSTSGRDAPSLLHDRAHGRRRRTSY